jgi:hypothetical protein
MWQNVMYLVKQKTDCLTSLEAKRVSISRECNYYKYKLTGIIYSSAYNGGIKFQGAFVS